MKRKMIALVFVLVLLIGAGVGIASAQYDSSGAQLPASNPEGTPIPRPTSTPIPQPTVTPTSPPTCDLDDVEQLVVKKLAIRYGVSEEEIAYWFCQGYGFGEIAIAYEISLRTDYTVEELFAMREEGLGWGEILIKVGLVGELPPYRGRMPWPVPPFDYKGRPPARNICLEGDENPIVEQLAELYGMTYEQTYRWICGPFDHTNFPFPEGNLKNSDSWEYNPGERMHIIAPDKVLPNVDLDDLPARGDIQDLIQDARTRVRPPRRRH